MEASGVRRRKPHPESKISPEHFHQHSHHRTVAGQISWLSWMFLLLVFYFSVVFINMLANNHLPAPKQVASSQPDEFTEDNARVHLENFMKMGSRVAGYMENDIEAHEYVRKVIEDIESKSNTNKRVEVDIQRPTGSFFMPHHDHFMSVYSNVTNTVVRVTSPQSDDSALLLNCHTDSVSNAPGASDDAVACTVLLEIFRAIMADKKPLLHPLIFLFNGAEETILQASHGFITQHKWVDEIKAFINLEAAGAGGKEFLFQTGPSNPWLMWAWANHAPYPHGSSVGQDLFQSGVIPSDTDFRIFRDHGAKPGIDLAYIKNGYVYHTIHDKPSMIHPGCIQRAGDNIHGVVKHLVQSTESLLPDPSEFRYGSVVYFDILGVTMVVIPMWVAVAMNYAALTLVLVYIARRMLNPDMSGFAVYEFGSVLVKAVAITILSFTSAFFCLFLVAVFMTKMDRPLSWYANTPLAVGIYFPAGLMGMIGVHGLARSYLLKRVDCRILETLFFDAVLVIWSALIFVTRNIGSSHFFTIPVLFAVLGRGYLGKDMFSNHCNDPGLNRVFMYIGLMTLPTSLHISKLLLLGEFFVTLSGRMGSEIPPDMILCFIVGLCILPCFSFMVCTTYLVDSMKWFYAIMTALLICSVTVAFTDFGFPFDNDPISPSNKRFIAQHTQREFYGFDGKLEKSDSGIMISHLDYAGNLFYYGSDDVKSSPVVTCKGPYCEMPVSLPVLKLVQKLQYVPAPPPAASATTDLYPFEVHAEKSSPVLDDGKYRVTYSVSILGPPHMTVMLMPLVNGSLVEWSLEGNPKDRNSKACASECYYILYTGGYEHPKWKFWLKFNVQSDKSEAVFRLDVSTHYRPGGLVDPVNTQSPALHKMTSQLHNWVAPMTWISTYKSFKF